MRCNRSARGTHFEHDLTGNTSSYAQLTPQSLAGRCAPERREGLALGQVGRSEQFGAAAHHEQTGAAVAGAAGERQARFGCLVENVEHPLGTRDAQHEAARLDPHVDAGAGRRVAQPSPCAGGVDEAGGFWAMRRYICATLF